MLYIVQHGDHLSAIAKRFQTTVPAILAANVICNPDYIVTGIPLIIPDPNTPLPKAGGSPYYVVMPGDSLWCLSQQFSTTPHTLIQANQITNPDLITAGAELLVSTYQVDPVALYNSWNIRPEDCDSINSIWGEALYREEFLWEAMGQTAVPYLTQLLNHSCSTIRDSAVKSLGRIGTGAGVRSALEQTLRNDPDANVADSARLSLMRMDLIPLWTKRIHLTTTDTELYSSPAFDAGSTLLTKGTPVIVHRWYIPSPAGDISGPGALAVFDFVQVTTTGQTGFLHRAGDAAITLL
ncbi:LysM peptidoglycan-binding domain-containing protein [Paenibacillus sp. MMS20-IR301]|uniref:LysM peptidoglycan-binding domain-containing protein n=1 Tax=Paenibacillus sp. MMS20-IR301 TaxID=2895946 RepID=UPI0028E22543|nr:LysM peptidoglycan-binding domain-containing protein [Paenibacillus sp. MMS20-IR301]WNS44291.1 LysM peptidoglycan-binding domain-containing protein [Paenibacillus sp. MMS20-IR301]